MIEANVRHQVKHGIEGRDHRAALVIDRGDEPGCALSVGKAWKITEVALFMGWNAGSYVSGAEIMIDGALLS